MKSHPYSMRRNGAIAHITFNRPDQSNALERDFWNQFRQDLQHLEDGETRALIINAEGANFCGGIDVSLFDSPAFMTDTPQHRLRVVELARYLQDVLAALEDARFPTICIVQGACVGAGLELAACCDIRVASKDAYFQIAETNVGIMADLGALQRITHLTSYSVAMDMALTGKKLIAEDAKACTLVSYLEDDIDKAMQRGLGLASSLAKKSPLALSGIKLALKYGRDHAVPDALEQCASLQGAIFDPQAIDVALSARKGENFRGYENLNPKLEDLS